MIEIKNADEFVRTTQALVALIEKGVLNAAQARNLIVKISHNAKGIEEYDLRTKETINSYESMGSAARASGVSQSMISRCCRGVYNVRKPKITTGWRYADI